MNRYTNYSIECKRGGFSSLLFKCVLGIVLALSMLPVFSSQAQAEEPDAPATRNATASVSYRQADGYEAYQGWQNSPWDEASDPWYGSSGGTTRKGYPSWSLADPLSIGVTGYNNGMVTGNAVTVVTDTAKTDTSGAGSFADPFYYKNVILQPYDVTQDTIQFTFNYVGAGGVNLAYTFDPKTPSGFIIAKSPNPNDWNSSGDPKNWVASGSVVWEATTANTIVQNTTDNWWKNITCTVDTSTLEANQTYYLAIKNGTAGQWGRVYADIVFEFSTDMGKQATWSGDASAVGYGREQGNGGTKLGLMEPAASDVAVDLAAISTCWDNSVKNAMAFNAEGKVSFKVHADGSGSNWQTIRSWTSNSEIKVYDADPVGASGYSVEGLTPVATIANGSIACSLVKPDRDWPSIDGVNVAVSNLQPNKSYWLVFTEKFLPGNATSPLRKPIVFGFKTAVATSWDASVAGDGSVTASLKNGVLSVSGIGAMKDYKQSGDDKAPWLANRAAEITSVVVGDGVTSIGACAFNGCSALVSVKGGNALASLGGYSFQGCPKVVTMDFASSTLTSVANFAFGGQVGRWVKRTVYLRDDASVTAMCGIGNSGATKMCLAVVNGGSFAEGASFEAGSLVPSLDKEGFQFSGWFSDAACTAAAPGWTAYSGPTAPKAVYAGYGKPAGVVASWEIGAEVAGNAKATLYEDGSFVISGTGDVVAIERWYELPWINYASQVKSVSFASGVSPTNLSYYFYKFDKLVHVGELPSSVENLTAAFYGCTSLESAPVLPSKAATLVSTFEGCTALLESPAIPEGATSVRAMLMKCASIKKAPVLPVSLTEIRDLFSGCTSLTEAPVIPAGIVNMRGVFRNCSSLTSAPLVPASVTDMTATFSGCAALAVSPVIPANGQNMNTTFLGCVLLSEAPEIPQGVTQMSGTFQGCTALKVAPVLPSTVSTLYQCFFGCTSLTQAPAIPLGVSDMKWTFGACSSLVEAPKLPDSVTLVEGLYKGCKSLKSVPNIPANVQNMDRMFLNCSSLETTPTIPASVTSLRQAFQNCTSLTEMSLIPASVANVTSAFSNCTSLVRLPKGLTLSAATLTGAFEVSAPHSASNLLSTYIAAPVDASLAAYNWTASNRKLIVQDFATLTAALTDADAAVKDMLASADGKDIVNGSPYVAPADLKAFTDAVAEAQAVAAKTTATQDDIDAAVQALAAAKTALSAVIKTAVTGFDSLNSSLGFATDAKGSVQASIDGMDIAAGKKWATQVSIDQLMAVIDAQQIVASKTTATQNEVDAAQKVVDDALKAFNDTMNTASPSTVALASAVAEAGVAAKVEKVSVDGKDVAHGKTWCTATSLSVLNDAIVDAQAIVDAVAAAARNRIVSDTSQNGVDAGLTALNTALATFNADVKTAAVDTSSLSAAFEAGDNNLAATVISTDGADVFVRSQWATKAQADAYCASLADARAVVQDAARTQNAVDAAEADLALATTVFDATKKAGLKVDASALGTTIEEAVAQVASAVVADDSQKVAAGTLFVSQRALDTYNASITQAKLVLANAASTQDEVDAAVKLLIDAQSAFDASKQTGAATSADGAATGSGAGVQGGSGQASSAGVGKVLASTGDYAASMIAFGAALTLAGALIALVARRRLRRL